MPHSRPATLLSGLQHRLLQWRPPVQAPVAGVAGFGRLLLLAVATLGLLMAQSGTPRLVLNWVDIASEGGTVLLLGLWLVQLRLARPAGRVTSVLALGLGALLLGQSMDLLDELWQLPKTVVWDNLLESGFNLAGVVGLTWGLHLWRQEQLAFSRTQRGRERLFREHRHLDALTALGDADYMAAQIEAERRSAQAGALVMLGWHDFPGLVLREGPLVAERLQRAAGAENVVVTLGGEGVLIFAPKGGAHHTDRLPAFNRSPRDVAGAGDSFFTCTAMALRVGADIWQAAYLGSLAAAWQVSHVGNTPMSAAELIREVSQPPGRIHELRP